ncbi:class II aldolase/adducin family protein [Pseudomonas sp. JM0905a]|uniref:Class II aldolase/adducin family protein n=1 Tax=Metapseudomonas resinovorans TaxID=53412 RepID=A0ABT4Y9I3_METRE|nr:MULTISPECIES: class II aldolase/adducin family protein [Pseudomonas]MBD2840329.1 class II aldolase/adducin family protein [Pseudomonas sp. JM0905a]MDA8485443.1 class II aldolase/adducin family protein [Pseudomonas resinovorans]
MTQKSLPLDSVILDQVVQAKRDFEKAFRVLKETRTITATNTLQAYLRVPASDLVIALRAPSPWADDQSIRASVVSHDGTVHLDENLTPGSALEASKEAGSGKRYALVFQERPEVNLVVHVHTPYLGGWAGAHRVLPLRYAASQRVTLARELPIYIDRRQSEPSFIVETIKANPHTPGLLEANGGATFWGEGILPVAKLILLVEEGAYFQALAENLGGSQEFGPGVLEQQWKMTGLWDEGRKLLEQAA